MSLLENEKEKKMKKIILLNGLNCVIFGSIIAYNSYKALPIFNKIN